MNRTGKPLRSCNLPTYAKDTCPGEHTPQPTGYLAWHHWAEKKAKTHVQRKCPVCGLWAIWVPR